MDFTFAGIKESLVRKVKEFSSWSIEILTIGVYSVLLDVISYGIERLAYYVDFLFVETTYNATLRASVVRLAKDKGYIPSRKSGAFGYLLVGTDETFSSSNYPYTGKLVEVLKWTRFQNTDGTSNIYSIEDSQILEGAIQRMVNPNLAEVNNLGNGIVGIVATAHGFEEGQQIYITGTKFYDGVYFLTSDTSVNRIAFVADYIEETFTGLEQIRGGYGIVKVREGIPQEYQYIAVGDIEERIGLYNDSIDENEIEVFRINESGDILETVNIVNDLYFANDLENYSCQIDNFEDYDGVWIIFGDGITAKRLNENDRFLIKYAITTGTIGDIKQNEVITESVNPFINVENAIEELFITNIEPIVGGADLQSLIEIKKQYSRLSSASYQLTNRNSWIAAIEKEAYIYKAYVYTQLDIGKGTISLSGTVRQNIHYVTAVTKAGLALTPSQEQEISLNNLIPYKSPTDIIQWTKLNKIRIKFVITTEIVNTISFTDMQERISNLLTEKFGVLNLDFSQNIYESNYIREIDLVNGVIRHETEAYYAEEDINVQDSLKTFLASKTSTNYPNEADQIYIVTDTPQIWIRRKIDGNWYEPVQMSETNGILMSGVNLFNVSGTMVYSANQLTYQCFDLLLDEVSYVAVTGTTINSNQTVILEDLTGLEVGMYASGLNIVAGTKISSINNDDSSIILTAPVDTSGEGTGEILFAWFPDPKLQFEVRNPTDNDEKGYLLYLIYQTKDGEGNRIGDLRLSAFNSLLDYSPELSEFNFIYS